MPHHILFRNATLITFSPTTSSLQTLHNHSLLIKDNRIAAIAPSISAPANAEIVDATDKILTPGFINTHTHMWQSAYRTLGPDVTLVDYFLRFGQYSPSIRAFGPEDVRVSALEGYLEGLNGGTTAFVEHAHANWSTAALEASYEAAVESGARVWWCAAAEGREGCGREEARGVMAMVRDRNEGQDALVKLGYAWDGLGGMVQDEGKMKEEKAFLNDLKVEAITVHHLGGPWKLGSSETITRAAQPPATLQTLDLPLIFSHAPFLTPTDASTLHTHNFSLSLTPESEMHFGHGQATSPTALAHASLGLDTNWTFSADMPTQARLFLQHVRANAYQKVLDAGQAPRRSPMGVEDAFLLLTRQGGLALRRPDLGVLQVGAKADIAVFDATSPNMAGWTDAVAAVVLHANVGDVEGVVVDGQWRKKQGKLVVDWEAVRRRFEEVARRVQREAKRLMEGVEGGEEGPFGGMMEWGEPEVFSTRRE